MSLSEVIKSNVSSALLPDRVREALQKFDVASVTAIGLCDLAAETRRGGALQLAKQLLAVGLDQFNLANDLRYRLEFAENLIAEGDTVSAHELLAQLRVSHPKNAHAFRIEAQLYVLEQDYASSLELLCRAPLGDPNPALDEDTIFRALKLKAYLATVKAQSEFLPPTESKSIEKAVAVMLVRDEQDVIAHNLLHHYTLGIRKFVVVSNRCVDQTEALVRAFQASHSEAIVCAITDPFQGHYQAKKTQAAFQFARCYFEAIQRNVEWCFVLDADEFISITSEVGLNGLIQAAEAQNKDVISFNLRNACPSSGHEYQGSAPIYSHFDTVVACAVPVVTKVAFRTDIAPRISEGNHSLFYKGISVERCLVAAELGAGIVHLPYRSTAQVMSKIVNGGSALEATNLHQAIGGHWRRLYDEYLRNGPAALATRLERYNSDTRHAAKELGRFMF